MPTNWYEIKFVWGQSIEVYDEAKARKYVDNNGVESVTHAVITSRGIKRTSLK